MHASRLCSLPGLGMRGRKGSNSYLSADEDPPAVSKLYRTSKTDHCAETRPLSAHRSDVMISNDLHYTWECWRIPRGAIMSSSSVSTRDVNGFNDRRWASAIAIKHRLSQAVVLTLSSLGYWRTRQWMCCLSFLLPDACPEAWNAGISRVRHTVCRKPICGSIIVPRKRGTPQESLISYCETQTSHYGILPWTKRIRCVLLQNHQTGASYTERARCKYHCNAENVRRYEQQWNSAQILRRSTTADLRSRRTPSSGWLTCYI